MSYAFKGHNRRFNSVLIKNTDNSETPLEIKNAAGTSLYSISNTGAQSTAAAQTITSTSANALAVGPAGTTNPTFKVDASTASAATGIAVTGAAAAAGVAVAVVSSGANEALTLDAKGSGTVGIGTVSTGAITLGAATGVTGAATVTSAGASALAVGRLGATTPALKVDASAATSVTGMEVVSAAAAGGVNLRAISSGANENLTINAKGSGTIGIAPTSTGIVTITPATTVTGAATLTGGIAQAVAPSGFHNWQPVTATSGTDTAFANGTQFVGSIFIPVNMTITGVGYLIGSVGGTDKVYVVLYNASGTNVANSDLTAGGATVGTAANVQSVALTATYAAVGPALYYIGVSANGATAKLRTIPAHCQAGLWGGTVAQVHGTVGAITEPVTFTADQAPVVFVY